MAEDTKDAQKSFKHTLNLPQTLFPIRAQPKIEDPQLIARWHDQDLYKKTFYIHQGQEKFIIIDGPPYANGPIHLGHAYNKILKDIVAKSQRMMGKQVPFVPGWDCHGLPIELKVSQANPQTSATELKQKCRVYAQEWIKSQTVDFKRLGVCMDWDHPYTTMDFDYEANIVRAFGILVEKGYIERKNKTVPWCYSCKTVLATAEIEYQERKDPSIYVLFELTAEAKTQLIPVFADREVSLVVWTTTPWTLMLNRAVLLKPNTIYSVLEVNNQLIVVAQALSDKICTLLSVEKKEVATFSSEMINNNNRIYAYNPLISGLKVPLLTDSSVLLDEGTACVNNAPGVGPEDYEIGIKNRLEIFSPITAQGTFTAEINYPELVGMSVDDAQIWALKNLHFKEKLLFKTSLRHSYPHCWRCHKGLIFRATKQWFCNLLHDNLKERTLQIINKIQMLPETSNNRLKATIENRLEWCLSRQRVWGTPLPALICTSCDTTFTNKAFIDKVADHIAQEGIEYWDRVTVEDLAKDIACNNCGNRNFAKEQDILDVWFDAGVGHFALLRQHPELQFPADMFLEGKDQHRGYFQSSLLTSMALTGESCMKTIVTHGFTVDETGKKMSKSIGNVVSPQEVMDEIGTDCLRMWAASIDCAGEAVISEKLLENVQEVFRKVRNTCRFLLSNLYDFDIRTDAVAFKELSSIDLYALYRLQQINKNIITHYKQYNFTAIFHQLADYCSVELSSFYLDIVKDRLYVEEKAGKLRRSTQTVCWYILDTLTKLSAPILSFMAEQISDHYQKDKKDSIHLQQFAQLKEAETFFTAHLSDSSQYEQLWQWIKTVRATFLKAIEQERAKQLIKHSLEAHIIAFFDEHNQTPFVPYLQQQLKARNETLESFFKELLIVSQFELAKSVHNLSDSMQDILKLRVQKAKGVKCPRCWQWTPSNDTDGLCDRCMSIVNK